MGMKLLIVLATVSLQLLSANGDTCSYENCPKLESDMLNVHLICHSHDDSGWLKTVDQYFWGSNHSITSDAVQYVLDTVTNALAHDPNKRFSYCESGFFSRWMSIQNDFTRHAVANLVRTGQMEIVGGGWVQNDEATTHYAAIIDQMTIGHQFLNTTFGRCGIPKVAWQIDPFGHSREVASLFAQMGLEGFFFARLHTNDRAKRREEKNMEMIWKGSDDLGNTSDIFTHALYDHYGPPPGFCFDESCGDDPIMDNTDLEGYNVDQRVDQFLSYVQQQSKSYESNNIILTMGSDFQYRNADRWFVNLDKLIKYVNQRQSKGSKVNVFYSTVACYTNAVKSAGIELQSKSDDFFPYADKTHSYWTGYFTSRPTLKGQVRQANTILQTCQAMDAIANLGPYDSGDVGVLRRAMGILQHHDAVSGTAKQHVTNDYSKMIHDGFLECQQVFNDALAKLAPKSSGNTLPPYSLCFNLNCSVCNMTQGTDQFLITLFNAMSQPLNTFLRLPVDGQKNYSIYDPLGHQMPEQLSQTFATTQFKDVPQGPYDLVFPVTVPAAGYSTYFVQKQQGSAPRTKTAGQNDDNALSNNMLTVQFDPSTGLLKSVTDKRTQRTFDVKQNFYWYKGATKLTQPSGQASGAYVFRPDGNTPAEIATEPVVTKKVDGIWTQEMRQTFAPWLTQTVRLYSGKPYVEFEWTVGPIPVDFANLTRVGKEIITRFDTTIANSGVFFTDANGRQMMKRTRNYQATYTYDNAEPVSGNYYPVNSRIFIKDASTQMTVLTDRSQGGSSVTDGSVELMVHRRLFEDDGYGVGEPLNEPGTDGRGLVVRGRHWLLLSEPASGARLHRQFGSEMFYQATPTFASFSGLFSDYKSQFSTIGSGIQGPVPPNLNILTIAQGPRSTILIRLEHIYQTNEDALLSKPATVQLKKLFPTFDIVSIAEMNLAANAIIKESLTDDNITLAPMQIRTFRLVVKEGGQTQKAMNGRSEVELFREARGYKISF